AVYTRRRSRSGCWTKEGLSMRPLRGATALLACAAFFGCSSGVGYHPVNGSDGGSNNPGVDGGSSNPGTLAGTWDVYDSLTPATGGPTTAVVTWAADSITVSYSRYLFAFSSTPNGGLAVTWSDGLGAPSSVTTTHTGRIDMGMIPVNLGGNWTFA